MLCSEFYRRLYNAEMRGVQTLMVVDGGGPRVLTYKLAQIEAMTALSIVQGLRVECEIAGWEDSSDYVKCTNCRLDADEYGIKITGSTNPIYNQQIKSIIPIGSVLRISLMSTI